MSGYHDPLDTFNPKGKTSAHWYSRDMEIEDWEQKKGRYTEEELKQHRAEWLAVKKANDEKNAKKQASISPSDKPLNNARTYQIMNDYKKSAIQIVAMICATWVICTLINSCTNRYYAIPTNQQILDKRSGEIFRPGEYPSRQEFGGKLKRVSR